METLVENHPELERRVSGLKVTDTKQSTIQVRRPVSGTDPGKTFDLRCEVREGLIEFLRRDYPESLPRVRNVDVDEPSESQPRKRKDDAAPAISGAEHERGSKAPGLHPDEKSDGAE